MLSAIGCLCCCHADGRWEGKRKGLFDMGFSIKVCQKTLCPHCGMPIGFYPREIYYCQKSFWNGDCDREDFKKQIGEALGIEYTGDVRWYDEFYNRIEISGSMEQLAKIRHLIDPEEYEMITAALKEPNTYIFASW